MQYVLGFQFNSSGLRVALSYAMPPATRSPPGTVIGPAVVASILQDSRWTGVGGHVECGELPRDAVARLFQEQTFSFQREISWRHYADLRTWDGHVTSLFSSFTDEVEVVRSRSGGEVQVVDLGQLPKLRSVLAPDVAWMVELALSARYKKAGGDGLESSRFLVVSESTTDDQPSPRTP